MTPSLELSAVRTSLGNGEGLPNNEKRFQPAMRSSSKDKCSGSECEMLHHFELDLIRLTRENSTPREFETGTIRNGLIDISHRIERAFAQRLWML
jgi:hypothetical protein